MAALKWLGMVPPSSALPGVVLPDSTVAVSAADRTWEVPGQHPVLRCRRTVAVSNASFEPGPTSDRLSDERFAPGLDGQTRSGAIPEPVTVASMHRRPGIATRQYPGATRRGVAHAWCSCQEDKTGGRHEHHT